MVARKGRGPVSLRKKKSGPVPSVAHCFIQRHLKVRYVRALWYTRQYLALSVACALSRNTPDLRLAIPYSPSHSLRSTDHQRDIRRMKYLSSKAVVVGAVALAALLSNKLDVTGKEVAIILSGGNIDPAIHSACLEQYPDP